MKFHYFLKTLSFVVLLGVTSIATSCSTTPTQNLTLNQQIDQLVQAHNQYGDLNASVLVSHQGQIIYKKAFGQANREWNIPNKTDTKFRIASITKQFTAMIVVQLAAENRLDLHTPIHTYLPNYPLPQGAQITAHHLLTHSSGIRDFSDEQPRLQRNPNRFSPVQNIQRISDSALAFPPGDHFEYSNSGYDLLAYLAEQITGQPYEKLLQERIFSPLGMTHSGLDNHRDIIENRANGYFKMWGKYANANYINMKRVYASGSIYSTVDDLFLWDRALDSNTLLPKEYHDLIFTPFIVDPDYHGHYGYGWEIGTKKLGNTDQTIPVQHHDGVINGFCALITRIPDSESCIILLSNKRRAPLNSITRSVLGILYNKTYDFPKKSVALETQKIIIDQGVTVAVNQFSMLKKQSDHYLSEQEFIILGYEYLHANDATTAASIFKMAIEAFPNADNPYDSYAESQMVLGNLEEAIANYKKSLVLNPNNQNAKNMLKKLTTKNES